MTRFRKTSGAAGRVVFVGAGPGDPGMLTGRASAALAEAGLVLVDPDVSVAVQQAVQDEHPGLEVAPAGGEPAEVAKASVAAAKNGTVVVRLVAGGPYTAHAGGKAPRRGGKDRPRRGGARRGCPVPRGRGGEGGAAGRPPPGPLRGGAGRREGARRAGLCRRRPRQHRRDRRPPQRGGPRRA